MAVLTKTITAPLWRALWARLSLKAAWASTPLPPLPKIHDAFQALENRLEASRATLKADIDGALGIATTPAQARSLMAEFLHWKAQQMREGN